jgi:S1-C subfamily serine protease
MINPLRFLVMCFLVLLGGCQFRGSVKPFPRQELANGQKIDAVVAYQSGSAKIQAINVSAPFSSYDIRVMEAIDKAFLEILSARFREVRAVADEGVSLRFEPAFAAMMNYMDMNGNVRIDLDLRLAAVEMATGEVGELFVVQQPMNYSPPGASAVLGFITGLSLFLLSPITLPMNAQVCGNKACGDLQQALSAMMVTMESDISARRQRVASLAMNSAAQPVGLVVSQDSTPSRYDAILDCVVVVKSRDGFGSGFFVSSKGHVVTNAHVVEGDSVPTIRLRSGATLLGRVVAANPALDVAVIETGLTKTAWLPLAEHAGIEVGAEVLAVGTPKGLDWSVTKGIISATGRGRGGVLVQTDAAINSGNSSGPLVSSETGKVLGISTLDMKRDWMERLGFAVAAPFLAQACAPYLDK